MTIPDKRVIHNFINSYSLILKPLKLLDSLKLLSNSEILSEMIIKTAVFSPIFTSLYSIMYRTPVLDWRFFLLLLKFGLSFQSLFFYFFTLLSFIKDIKISKRIFSAFYLSSLYLPPMLLLYFLFMLVYCLLEIDIIFFVGLLFYIVLLYSVLLLFASRFFSLPKYLIVVILSLMANFAFNVMGPASSLKIENNELLIIDPIFKEYIKILKPIINESISYYDIQSTRFMVYKNYIKTQDSRILETLFFSHTKLENIRSRLLVLLETLHFKKNIKLTEQFISVLDSALAVELEQEELLELRKAIEDFDIREMFSEFSFIISEIDYFLSVADPIVVESNGLSTDGIKRNLHSVIESCLELNIIATDDFSDIQKLSLYSSVVQPVDGKDEESERLENLKRRADSNQEKIEKFHVLLDLYITAISNCDKAFDALNLQMDQFNHTMDMGYLWFEYRIEIFEKFGI